MTETSLGASWAGLHEKKPPADAGGFWLITEVWSYATRGVLPLRHTLPDLDVRCQPWHFEQ